MQTVVDNEAEERFEVELDGRLAQLVYDLGDGDLALIHTEVPSALEGHGIGGQLVTAAVDRAVQDGLTIIPQCPFARGWLQRHPDIAGRAAIRWPANP